MLPALRRQQKNKERKEKKKYGNSSSYSRFEHKMWKCKGNLPLSSLSHNEHHPQPDRKFFFKKIYILSVPAAWLEETNRVGDKERKGEREKPIWLQRLCAINGGSCGTLRLLSVVTPPGKLWCWCWWCVSVGYECRCEHGRMRKPTATAGGAARNEHVANY